MRSILDQTKRSQFESVLLVVIFVFIVGVILVFMNRVNEQLYDSLDQYFEDSDQCNNIYYENGTLAHVSCMNSSEAERVTTRLVGIEQTNMWDYASLAIFFGLLLQMLVFSFATRISVVFYWIFAVLGSIIVLTGVVLSNIWQKIVINPEFADTIARFPITNALLGNYFPTIVTGILLLAMVILFGKSNENQI